MVWLLSVLQRHLAALGNAPSRFLLTGKDADVYSFQFPVVNPGEYGLLVDAVLVADTRTV